MTSRFDIRHLGAQLRTDCAVYIVNMVNFAVIYCGNPSSKDKDKTFTEIGGPDGAAEERETLANCGDGRGEGVDRFISVSRDV